MFRVYKGVRSTGLLVELQVYIALPAYVGVQLLGMNPSFHFSPIISMVFLFFHHNIMIYTIAAVMLRFIGLFCLGDVCHNDRRFLTTGGVQEGSAACRPSGLYLRFRTKELQ